MEAFIVTTSPPSTIYSASVKNPITASYLSSSRLFLAGLTSNVKLTFRNFPKVDNSITTGVVFKRIFVDKPSLKLPP